MPVARTEVDILKAHRRRPARRFTLERELRDRLRLLSGRLGVVGGDRPGRGGEGPDARDSGPTDEPVLEGVDLAVRVEIGLILRALRRLANGTYGTCTGCGRAIDQARLRVLPTAVFCRRCAGDEPAPLGN